MSAHPRFHSPAFAMIAMAAAVLALPAAAFDLARGWIERAVAFAFHVLARPVSFATGFGPVATADGPALAYDGPPVHQLRHEVGVSRRSAARNT